LETGANLSVGVGLAIVLSGMLPFIFNGTAMFFRQLEVKFY